MKKQHQGFHLIELLITLLIVGILASMGFSRYTQYMTEAHRLEAEQTLGKLAIALEQYQIEQNSYANANLERLHFSPGAIAKHYQFSIQATDIYYVLTAKPIGAQAARDSECGSLMLNAKGQQSATGSQNCWLK